MIINWLLCEVPSNGSHLFDLPMSYTSTNYSAMRTYNYYHTSTIPAGDTLSSGAVFIWKGLTQVAIRAAKSNSYNVMVMTIGY